MNPLLIPNSANPLQAFQQRRSDCRWRGEAETTHLGGIRYFGILDFLTEEKMPHGEGTKLVAPRYFRMPAFTVRPLGGDFSRKDQAGLKNQGRP